MKIINLLPKEEIKELQLDQASGQMISFWVWTIITLGVLFVLSISSTIILSQRISSNNNEIENKKQTLRSSTTKQLEEEVSAINRQIALIDSLRKDHYYWSRALIELINLMDTDTSITTVQLDRESGKVEFSGVAADRESVLSFWAAVKKSHLFKNIDFPLSNLERDVNANFRFNFYVKPEELQE